MAGSSVLQSTIENLFSSQYLFHKDHRAWAQVVLEGDGAPRTVDLFQLGTFTEIAVLTSPVPAIMVAQIAAAVKESTVVELVRNEKAEVCGVRRRDRLDVQVEDPDLRTVFVKPVHYDARDEDITSFFSRWGQVVSVERRQYLSGAVGSEKVRPSTFVVFATVAEARACVAAKPSYGHCDTPLGQLWVPQLTVMMKETHDRAQSDLVQRGAAQARQQAVAATSGAAADDNADFETNKYLRPRCTCKVWDLTPSNPACAWQNIKAKLGNLALSNPALRRRIGMVHSNGTSAYVVCKSPETAQGLLTAFATLSGVNAEAASALREAVPRLTLLEGEEEEEFMRIYPGIVTKLMQKKVVANSKRDRD